MRYTKPVAKSRAQETTKNIRVSSREEAFVLGLWVMDVSARKDIKLEKILKVVKI